MGHYFAFDFDGVVCQSANESGLTAWRGAHQLWPESVPAHPSDDFAERFPKVRPVIETGHENLVVVKLIVEGLSDAEILADFASLRSAIIARDGLDPATLRRAFGSARDHWLSTDEESWLDVQGFYPGVVEAINGLTAPRCIITTKEDRFTRKLVARAGLQVEPNRIYALEAFESGGKRSVLATLGKEFPDMTLHFFEDRLKTLMGIKNEALARLYLVDWGYNTPAERALATQVPEISLIDMAGFESVLKTHDQAV